MWSHDVVSQSINLAQDLKAGQYLKIPGSDDPLYPRGRTLTPMQPASCFSLSCLAQSSVCGSAILLGTYLTG
jgi:hypothetical protein